MTKGDFAVFQERLENRFSQIDNRFLQIDSKFAQIQQFIVVTAKETEFRVVTRLGFLVVSTTTIAVALLTWLIKT